MDTQTKQRAQALAFVEQMERCKLFPCRGGIVCLSCAFGRSMCEEDVYPSTFTAYLEEACAFRKLPQLRHAKMHVRDDCYRCVACGREGYGHHMGDLAGEAGGDENERRRWVRAVTKLRAATGDALERWVVEYASGDPAAAATLAAAPAGRIVKWLRRERDKIQPFDSSRRRWDAALDELGRRAGAAETDA